jgi:hypothetical protein
MYRYSVDDLVYPMSAALRPAAMEITARLRASGRSVDLVGQLSADQVHYRQTFG